MAEFVDYKDALLGEEIGWDIEYKPVWDVEGKIADWMPKAAVYARGGRAEVVLADVGVNYVIKADKDGNVYINDNKYNFESPKPVEKRGLYDLYIENHIDTPDTISKDSPCYKQFMKELEGK